MKLEDHDRMAHLLFSISRTNVKHTMSDLAKHWSQPFSQLLLTSSREARCQKEMRGSPSAEYLVISEESYAVVCIRLTLSLFLLNLSDDVLAQFRLKSVAAFRDLFVSLLF